MSTPHQLPDSRLRQNPSLGTVMVDWELSDKSTVRLEAQPIYCANCGVEYGYVPRETTTFVFWLCGTCFRAYGHVAGTCAVPDEEFNRDLQEEMQRRYGRALSHEELTVQAEDNNLGPYLEALQRDSLFRNRM